MSVFYPGLPDSPKSPYVLSFSVPRYQTNILGRPELQSVIRSSAHTFSGHLRTHALRSSAHTFPGHLLLPPSGERVWQGGGGGGGGGANHVRCWVGGLITFVVDCKQKVRLFCG